MRPEMLTAGEDFFTPIQEVPTVPMDDFFVPIQDQGFDDFFTPLQDFEVVALPVELMQKTYESSRVVINPFTGLDVIDQQTTQTTVFPMNPFTAMEVPAATASVAVVREENESNQDERTAAMQVFKKYFNTARAAGKAYDARHRMVCTGKDGHTFTEFVNIEPTISEDVVEEILLQKVIGNANLYEKLTSKEPITAEVEKEILSMAAVATDEVMGTSVSDYIIKAVEDLSEYEDFQFEDPETYALIVEQALSNHIHSAECGHGGPDISGLAYNPSFGFEGSGGVFRTMNSGHEHHNKLVVCPHCAFKKVAHVHGSKGPQCARCGKGRMVISEKKKR